MSFLWSAETVARNQHPFLGSFFRCLTLTMTINQAITRCKCNALNIFPNLHPQYFLTDSLGKVEGKWKSPSGTLQFIWKLNLRQICADSWLRFLSFQLPQKFSLWQLHELDYSAGSRYVYRVSSHVFGPRQATLHSFLSSYVNFGSSWFVGGPKNFTGNRRQQHPLRKT